jgi:hypothetical protein
MTRLEVRREGVKERPGWRLQSIHIPVVQHKAELHRSRKVILSSLLRHVACGTNHGIGIKLEIVQALVGWVLLAKSGGMFGR